jgi:hypothetical protein
MNNVVVQAGVFAAQMGATPAVSLSGTGIVASAGVGVFSATGGLIVAPLDAANWVFFVVPTNKWICAGTSKFLLGTSKLGGGDVLG